MNTQELIKIEDDYLFSAFGLITNITLFICTIVVMLIYSPLLTLSGIVFRDETQTNGTNIKTGNGKYDVGAEGEVGVFEIE